MDKLMPNGDDSIYENSELFFKLKQSNPSMPTPQSFPSREELTAQANGYIATIWTSYEELQSIIVRYETQIRKKWSKLSFARREALLKAAWPSITAERNMAIHFYFKGGIDK